jgi:hypothetical protein
MSKKSTMILGYTRAGHEVRRPTRRLPAPGEFADWARGDHVDASRILKEHSEREQDPEISSWCRRWARALRTMRRSARRLSIRGAAEISVKIRGPR